MRYTLSSISKKYAQAYVNEYQDTLTLPQIQNLKEPIQFFRQCHNFLSIVSILIGKQSEFEELLDEMVDHFSLPHSMQNLIRLLIEHKRLHIFAQILQDIYCLYMLKNDILELSIITAQPIDQDQKIKFENFFKKLSKKKIISTAIVDTSLIAGIRMQSDLFLWQYSIKSNIAKISKNMLDGNKI